MKKNVPILFLIFVAYFVYGFANKVEAWDQNSCTSAGYSWCNNGCYNPPTECSNPPSFTVSTGKGLECSNPYWKKQVTGASIDETYACNVPLNTIPNEWQTQAFDLSGITPSPYHEAVVGLLNGYNLWGGHGDYVVTKEYRRASDGYLIAKVKNTWTDLGINAYYPTASVTFIVGYVPCEIISNGNYYIKWIVVRGGTQIYSKQIDFTVSGINSPLSSDNFSLKVEPNKLKPDESANITVTACGNNTGNSNWTMGQNTRIDSLYYAPGADWPKGDYCDCGGLSKPCKDWKVSFCSNTWTIPEPALGTYWYYAGLFDANKVWHWTVPQYMPVTVAFSDTTLPNTPVINAPADGSTQNADFSVSVSGDGDSGGSGLATCYYHVLNSGVAGWTKISAVRPCSNSSGNSSFTVTVGPSGDCWTSSGTCTIFVFAKDNAGNTGANTFRTFNIVSADTTAPTVSVMGAPTAWQKINAEASVSCSDAGSGCDTTSYKMQSYVSNPGACPESYSGYTINNLLTVPAHLWICAVAKDLAGKVGISDPVEFKVDKDIPNTPTITSPAGDSTQSTDFSVSVSGDGDTGGSGNNCLYYIWDSGVKDWTKFLEPRNCDYSFLVTVGPGKDCRTSGEACTVFVSAKDNAGNEGVFTYRTFNIVSADTTAPTVGTISFYPVQPIAGQQTVIYAPVSDAQSGVKSCSLSVNSINVILPQNIFQGPMDLVADGTGFSRSVVLPLPIEYSAQITCLDNAIPANSKTTSANITVNSAPPCSAPANPTCSFNPTNGITLNWNPVSGAGQYNMQWAKFGQSYRDGTVDALNNAGSKITSQTSMNTSIFSGPILLPGVSDGTWYKLRTMVENSDSSCSAPSGWSQETQCFTGSCKKVQGSLLTNTVIVPLSNGQNCVVTISHFGEDLTDNSAVSYESLSSGNDFKEIGMDDNPSSGCQNDIMFANQWTIGTGALSVKSSRNNSSAANNLAYGYKLQTGDNCAILSAARQSCTLDTSSVVRSCDAPIIDPNRKTAASTQLWQNSFFIQRVIQADYQYTIVPDNSPTIYIPTNVDPTIEGNWHKGSPANLSVNFKDDISLKDGYYKIGSAEAWQPVPLFPVSTLQIKNTNHVFPFSSIWGQLSEGSNEVFFKSSDEASHCKGCNNEVSITIKKDTVAPTSRITAVNTYEEDIEEYREPGSRPDYPSFGYSSAFLNADDEGNTEKIWWVYAADVDTTSGLNTCRIAINGAAKPDRPCTGWVKFTVGKPGTGADCEEEGDDKCTIKIWAQDKAGNATATKNVNAVTPQEKDYIDGIVVQDANEFKFSVDWKNPTAQ